jgi:hypothetical protein
VPRRNSRLSIFNLRMYGELNASEGNKIVV